MILANMSNGLAFPHDDICYFQSQYGHQFSLGYFRHDSMPYSAVVALLKGESLTIIDATRRYKRLTDAQKYGIPTWCLVFNRAIHRKDVVVCDWQTREMQRAALSEIHKPYVNTIRKLANIYGWVKPAVISDNVILECQQGAIWDDQPKRLKAIAV